MTDFPLPGLFREIAEAELNHAQDLLDMAVDDLRTILAGGRRSNCFRADTDPIDLVIQGATQVELCRVTIKLDDEAIAAKKETKS